MPTIHKPGAHAIPPYKLYFSFRP